MLVLDEVAPAGATMVPVLRSHEPHCGSTVTSAFLVAASNQAL